MTTFPPLSAGKMVMDLSCLRVCSDFHNLLGKNGESCLMDNKKGEMMPRRKSRSLPCLNIKFSKEEMVEIISLLEG